MSCHSFIFVCNILKCFNTDDGISWTGEQIRTCSEGTFSQDYHHWPETYVKEQKQL